ncbi:MAG: hypothetical protein K6E85_03185 [Lachnospiraceae bacterium]|nr:hypothetical protein [Lachnospiraceae bacterium]
MDFEEMLGIKNLGLYFSARVEGFEGENFTYSVYSDGVDISEMKEKIAKAVDCFVSEYETKNIYMGYIDVSVEGEKVFIYQDLGNVEPENNKLAVQELLKAVGTVSGVKEVVINEGLDMLF